MALEEKQVRQILGDAIRNHRKKLGLSQEQVAFDAGLSATYLSLVEQGHRYVTVYRLALIADAMGSSVRELAAEASL